MENAVAALKARALFDNITDDSLEALCARESITIYAGFDPTATSLTIGNLVPVRALRLFQRTGHRVIGLVGGGTAMIGDPSGKRAERTLMTEETVAANKAAVRLQLERLLDAGGPIRPVILDNAAWIGTSTVIEFLRDVGKYFRLGEMLGKESVRGRLESEAGISFTEFSYMLLQAWDFLRLYQSEGCIAQCGGGDQWGNITAGTELIRKALGGQGYGVTFPLLTTAAGEKIGKTAAGAIWLDAAMTSPYEYYQYWVRSDDADVEKLLKIFTDLDLPTIHGILEEHRRAPELRIAQKRLAYEVTAFLHGGAEADKAEMAARALFSSGPVKASTDAEVRALYPDVPTAELPRQRMEEGLTVADLFVESGLCASRGKAKDLVKAAGAYINGDVATDPGAAITTTHILGESMILLRSGKKTYRLVHFTGAVDLGR